MARVNLVLRSINDDGGSRCVDLFRRPDGSCGFEEFRRDVEDGGGWFAIGGYSALRFDGEDDALAAAVRQVAWLQAALPASSD